MYRENFPPATLLPVPRALEISTLDHGLRSNDSDFGALNAVAPRVRAGASVIAHSLPFRVRVVCDESQLLRVQALRQLAYGRHLPEQAASFGSADPLDRLDDTTIFFAEDKASGRVVGSARVQSNRLAPLQIERSVELGRVPSRGVSPQPGQAEMRGTQRATADSRVGTVSLSVCRPSSCM